MEHFKHYYQGKGTAALLHVEMTGQAEMNCKLTGDPVIVSKMIANAMNARQDIAAAMIAAVISWADMNGIPREAIGNMVQFHKPKSNQNG